jgi:hypothetical protein
MLRRLLALFPFCTAALTAAPALPAKPDLHLFLLAGQSNMAGRGSLQGLTAAEAAAHPRILALNTELAWQSAVDPLHWDKVGAGVGPGKFFARVVADQSPGATIGLIPSACGGSPISAWEPGKYFEGTKSHPYDDALARARRALQDGTLQAILWHQGESDANAQAAPLYEKRLEVLIARFRADLGAPELPFILGQLGQFPAKPWNAHQIEVDRAQRAVAARVKKVRYVSSDGLVATRDNLHFETDALRVLGQRYAEAYLGLRSAKP